MEVVVFPRDLKVNEKSPLLVQRLAYFASGTVAAAAVSGDRMPMPSFMTKTDPSFPRRKSLGKIVKGLLQLYGFVLLRW